MALEVVIVSGSGQEHAGCLLLTSEVLFVVSVSEDTQQQAFPITEVTASPGQKGGDLGGALNSSRVSVTAGVSRQVECQQEPDQQNQLTLTLQQQTVNTEPEVRLPVDAHSRHSAVGCDSRKVFKVGANRGRNKGHINSEKIIKI